jgi:hypothetical protein
MGWFIKLCLNLVKGANANNEYIVGDIVGNYEVKGIVGRGT